MTFQMILTLVIFVGMIVMIMSDKFAFGAPPLVACVLLVLTGAAPIETVFSGFIDKNVIMIAGFMTVVAALQKTTLMGKVKDSLYSMAGKGGFKNYVLMLIFVMLAGHLISGTAYYMLVISIIATIPYNKKLPVSKILLPVAFATYFSGFIPINTAMMSGIIASLLGSSGAEEVLVPAVTMGLKNLCMAVVFFVWALIAYRFLPDHPLPESEEEAVAVEKKAAAVLPKWQENVVYAVFVLVVLNMIFLGQMGDAGYAGPGVGAAVLFVTGCLSFKEVRDNIASPLVLMMASIIGVAAALSSCGITGMVGDAVAGLLSSASVSPFLIVLIFTVLTSVFATFTGASFGSLYVFAPIGISVCLSLGYNPTALGFACVSAAWINWFMPIDGMPALVMGKGGYKMTEFWTFTLPLWVFCMLALTTFTTLAFPL